MSSKDESPTENLAKLASDIRFSGLVKDRSWKLRKYKRVMVGQELVDWMIEQGKVKSREEARALGQLLVDNNHIVTVEGKGDRSSFDDKEKKLYKFAVD